MSVPGEISIVVDPQQQLSQLRPGLTTSDGSEELEQKARLSREIDGKGRQNFALFFGFVFDKT